MADKPINMAPSETDAVFSFYGRKNDTTNDLVQYPENEIAHAVGKTASDAGKFPIVDATGKIAWLSPGTDGSILRIASGAPAYLAPGTSGNALVSTGSDIAFAPFTMQFLASSGAVSGAASIDFTTGFSSSFDKYIFEFLGVYPSTDTAQIRCVISENAGSSYHSTNYINSGVSARTPSTLAVLSGSGISQSHFQLTEAMDNAATSSISGSVELLVTTTKASVSSRTNGLYNDAAAVVATYQSGYRATTARANAIRFLASSGNINATAILMYGVSNS